MILFIGHKNEKTMSLIGHSDEADVVKKTGVTSFQQILDKIAKAKDTASSTPTARGRQVNFKTGYFVQAVDF
jgi:hypothetical protein